MPWNEVGIVSFLSNFGITTNQAFVNTLVSFVYSLCSLWYFFSPQRTQGIHKGRKELSFSYMFKMIDQAVCRNIMRLHGFIAL